MYSGSQIYGRTEILGFVRYIEVLKGVRYIGVRYIGFLLVPKIEHRNPVIEIRTRKVDVILAGLPFITEICRAAT